MKSHHGKFKETKEDKQPIDFIRQNALKLIEVDHSWTAFFFGKAYARRKAGFDQYDLSLIAEQNQKDKAAYRAMHGVILEFSPHLEKRSKELTFVDSSWKLMFGCINKESLRQQAGFSYAEVHHIELQRKKEFQKKIKEDNHFYKKTLDDLYKVDSSWKAYFFGRDYARSSSGFDAMKIQALNDKHELEDKAAKERALATRKTKKVYKPINPERLAEIRQIQAERKDDLVRRTRGL